MSEWFSPEELILRAWPATCRVHRDSRLPQTVALADHCTIESGVEVEAAWLACGEHTYIGRNVRMKAHQITLGESCVFFDDARILAIRDVFIGSWSKIGPGCRLMAGDLRIGCEFWMNEHAEIGGGGWRSPGAVLCIGDGCHLGRNSHVNVAEDVTWGNDTAVGMDCVLATHAHWQPVTLGYGRKSGPIKLGRDVAIYSRAVISPGVCIEDGATVAAGAVVATGVGPRELVGGVPAKLICVQQPPRDLDDIVRSMLRSICKMHWPDTDVDERPGWFSARPPGGDEQIVFSEAPQESGEPRLIQITTAEIQGSGRRCIFNVLSRYLDGFSSPTTELLRNALFRYGLRFRYRSYKRGPLDPKRLLEEGFA
jgi:acetyltransferase-like isoleucine patch superfamily enzyme